MVVWIGVDFMSFSSSVKDELSKVKIENNSTMIAELSGYLRMCGTIRILNFSELGLFFSTENASVARRILTFIKKLYTSEVELAVRKNRQLKRKNSYLIRLGDTASVRVLLDETSFIRSENVFSPNYQMDPSLIRDTESLSGYIRACFLGSGSITNPEKAYHLEFVTNNKEHGHDLVYWLSKVGFEAKCIERKDVFVVYLKEAEMISDLLAFMGGSQSVLQFESTRVIKDVRNNVNRLVNCETANLSKTINASMKQIEDIKYIDRVIGLAKLDNSLRQIANYRLENPEASLQEIGQSLQPNISKSGVNRRLKKIHDIADQLKGDVK